MNKILIEKEIKNCKECPFMKITETYSTDGFDKMDTWFCDKSKKKIQGDVEWHEESKIKIPEWCEIIVKE
jgi:hypothetical protein